MDALATKREYRVLVERRLLLAGLALVAVSLLAIHSVLTIYHYSVAEVDWVPWRQLFDVDEENNLPTWFSGVLLGLTAFLVWLNASAQRTASDPRWIYWRLLALGFLLLCIDEVAGLHESFNTVTDVTWAIPGGILAVVVGLSFFPFLWNLPFRTRNTFILAGALYVGGAVGVEMIGEPMDADSMLYNLTTVVEEGMEMAGVLVFLSGLLRFMGDADDAPVSVDVLVAD